MTDASTGTTLPEADKEKRAAALSSVIAAVALTGMKIVVGLLTGSLGILAEAAHSGLDLVAALVTWVAVRFSGQPADREHTYGHGKVENLSALFETVLLLVTCAWIIYEAVRRLFFETVVVETSLWSFLVMAISIVIDYSRSRMLARAAKKYNSQALEADALHFSTDIWSSAVVIGGLVFVGLAEWWNIPWLAKADAVAALGVSLIVIYVSVELGNKTIRALLDGVPAGLRDEVAAAARVPGVLDVKRVRIRHSGPDLFADLELVVGHGLGFERAHAIACQAEEAVRRVLPGADMLVHLEPDGEDSDDVLHTVRRLADRRNLSAHGIRVYHLREGLVLEMHLELSDQLQVAEAHALATDFEQAVCATLPNLQRIVTHLEPVGYTSAATPALRGDETQLQPLVMEVAREQGLPCTPHDFEIEQVEGRLDLAFHCTVASTTLLVEAQRLTERLEQALRLRRPDLGRVVIHVEPPEEPPAPAA